MAEEKTKLLFLMKILLEETDREHILNAAELIERMENRYALTCNRKTIYGDIERLREFGLKIEQVKGERQGYYVAEREFSLPELKLLVDAVQASNFITRSKSDDLIRKLEHFTSRENARLLQRQVFIYNRPKTENETVFLNVDRIHEAMAGNCQIRFQYCEWTVKKELAPRRGGRLYEVSPWSLTWDDENYYLVGFEESSGKIKHYRVDKMKSVELSRKDRVGRENFEGFDLAAFSKKTFGMYGGQDVSVTLECDNWVAGILIDRFGRDIMLLPLDAEHFRTHVLVSVSPQFFGWVTGIGEGLRITGPAGVRDEYRAYLAKVASQYEKG